MSYAEALAWSDYARRRGGIDRTERLLAQLTLMVNRALGGKMELSDLLPEITLRSDPETASKNDLNTVFNILLGASK